MSSNEIVLRASDVRKSYRIARRELPILHGCDLELARGERLALMGPSGAGKSTFLHVLGLLDRPSAGRVEIEGADAWRMNLIGRARLRNERLGFVFQFYHLVAELTALENVVLPAMIRWNTLAFDSKKAQLYARASELLERFGLEERMKHRPPQLSGGERQRVALARALFHDPPILIADEPTGNLDRETGEKVLELLFEEQARRQLSLLLVTHDERLAARCERVARMDAGRIHSGLRA